MTQRHIDTYLIICNHEFLGGRFSRPKNVAISSISRMAHLAQLYIVILLGSALLASCGGRMNAINTEDSTPVIRTDFTDDAMWRKIQKDVSARYFMGFSANVRFINDRQYSGLSGQEVLQEIPGLDQYGCVFIADAATMRSEEHHLLVLDPYNPTGETFRVIPSEAWGVENNLAITNMDYSEFLDAADPDGVFRGFR